MGSRWKYFFIGFFSFVQLVSCVPIDEDSRTSTYSNVQQNFINSANKLSSSPLENRFISSSDNLGASMNSIGSLAKSFNDKFSHSSQKRKPSSSQSLVSSDQISTPNTGLLNSVSVNSLTDATASSSGPASLLSSGSLSNSGRILFNFPLGSTNQAPSILGTPSGSLASYGPSTERSLADDATSLTTVSSFLNPLSDSVSDINPLSFDITKSLGSSTFNRPLSSFSSQLSTKRETDLESTTSFPSHFNINSIQRKPVLILEGISTPYSVREDSSSTISSLSAACNSNGQPTNSLAKSSFSENSISSAINNNGLNNIKSFNPLGKFSNPLQSDAIAQSVSESSTSVSTADNNLNGNGFNSNNIAGFTNSFGQPNANRFSSEGYAISGANNLINNNMLNNNLISGSVSSLAQQSQFSGVPQSSVSISNAQTITPFPISFTNFNSNQGLNSLTNSASLASNDVSSANNPFATYLNQDFLNQQSNNFGNIKSDTQSSSIPAALSSSSIGTQSFSLSSPVSSQIFNPVNTFSFTSDRSSINNAITNSAGTETNSIDLSPNSQAFNQNIFANAQVTSIDSSSKGFSTIGRNSQTFVPYGIFSENVASQLNSPPQFNTPAPSNLKSLSSYTSNGVTQSTSYQSPFALNNAPSLSPINNQASLNQFPGTLSLQSTSTQSSFASNNPPISSLNNQPSFNISPNTLNIQSTSTESSVSSNNPSFSSGSNQASFKIVPNTLNLQPLTSINEGSLANAIKPAISLVDTQDTQSINNGVMTEQVESISSSTTSPFGNGLNFAQSSSSVGVLQSNSGLQSSLPLQFANLPYSSNNPRALSLNNPLGPINPDQRYNSLQLGSLTNGLSYIQPGSATDNSVNTVVTTTSSSNPFGVSSLNSNIAESSVFKSSLANGFGNTQSPLVSSNQFTENSVNTIATSSSVYPTNSINLAAFNNCPSSINAVGRGFNINSPSPIDSSNMVIEKSLNSVSITPSQNQFNFPPYNSNADSSITINSLGGGFTNNAQSSTLSSIGSVTSAIGSSPSSNTFPSTSINTIQDLANNQPYYNIPINGATNQAFNIPNIKLLNSYPSNNVQSQNEAFSEQLVQNVNMQPIPQLAAPFNQLSTPITNSYATPSSNFASSNSISALSTSSLPTDLSHTIPTVTSSNQGNAVSVSDSLTSQQLGFSPPNPLLSGFSLPPSTLSNTVCLPSSIVISPGFTQTSLPSPVLAAPSYLPPIYAGNSRSTDCVNDFIELIVLSELFNGIDCNSNCINNPLLPILLTCL